MLDNPGEFEIYPTGKFYDDLQFDIEQLLSGTVNKVLRASKEGVVMNEYPKWVEGAFPIPFSPWIQYIGKYYIRSAAEYDRFMNHVDNRRRLFIHANKDKIEDIKEVDYGKENR